MPGANNKINWGLCNMYYAIATETNGVITYADPVKFPGAVNMTTSAKDELVEFIADNIIYFRSRSNMGYDVTLEMANIPEEFARDVLGETQDAKKVMIESSDDQIKYVALLGQFEGDIHKKRFCLYYCFPSRPNMDGASSRQKEPKTRTLTFSADPRPDGIVKASTTSETDATVYGSWFEDVYEKTAV